MASSIEFDVSHWISLGPATRILNVNEATLRRWADQNLVRSYRTPGGHRRFSQEDLLALTEQSHLTSGRAAMQSLADRTMQYIRRYLRHPARPGTDIAWHQHIQEDSRGRLRLFGRRLLTLATDYQEKNRRRLESLTEARFIGEEYGVELGHLELSLEDAIKAFIFFRNSLMGGFHESEGMGDTAKEKYRAWQWANAISDEALKGVALAYQNTPSR